MLIPFTQLQKKYKFQAHGVVHVGAHEGQEIPEYHKLGIDKMIMIEALPDIYQRLVRNSSAHPDVLCFNECVSDTDGTEIVFNRANNDSQSSSFLQLGTHKQMHPEVKYTQELKMKTVRLDTLLKGLDADFDFLNMDIQGCEGHALKGLGAMIKQFRYLYLEVNKTAVYEGCMQLPELEEYLNGYGFERKETLWPGNCTWGDSFWMKK